MSHNHAVSLLSGLCVGACGERWATVIIWTNHRRAMNKYFNLNHCFKLFVFRAIW